MISDEASKRRKTETPADAGGGGGGTAAAAAAAVAPVRWPAYVTDVDKIPRLVPRKFAAVVPVPAPPPGGVRGPVRVLKMPGRFTKERWPDLLSPMGFRCIPCKNRSAYHTLSPMLLGPVLLPEDGSDGVWADTIEDAWQGSKVWPSHLCGASVEDEAAWLPAWLKYNEKVRHSGQALRHRVPEAERRQARGKTAGTPTNPNAPLFSRLPDGRHLSYVEARRLTYMPWYEEISRDQAAFVDLQRRHERGQELLIMDPDGIHPTAEPQYAGPLSERIFCQLLRDSTRPFGHGLVLAACLMGFPVWRYDDARIDAILA